MEVDIEEVAVVLTPAGMVRFVGFVALLDREILVGLVDIEAFV